ncbi:MAG TPA: septal ring lytic transglycosylase RlpA family protein [Bacteroidia bacterium]|nr:septal ring lytic transglycosylase RlpA family protein [Bacteroidia bacterium]
MKLVILTFISVIFFQFLEIKNSNVLAPLQQLYKAKGKASYYANKFNKRRTSSGEIFYNDSLTAAHKTLPFGTILKVTNLSNDSVVVVRVNDRLPKKSSRIIDLSRAAAQKLNFISKGLTQVYLEEIVKK